MNKQEIFTTVVSHLRRQGRKSLANNSCSYRGNDGAMCAIGCLIPDEEYNPAMEGMNLHGLRRQQLTPRSIADVYEHFELMLDLQFTHDFNDVVRWENRFKSIAEKNNLEYTPPSIVDTLRANSNE